MPEEDEMMHSSIAGEDESMAVGKEEGAVEDKSREAEEEEEEFDVENDTVFEETTI